MTPADDVIVASRPGVDDPIGCTAGDSLHKHDSIYQPVTGVHGEYIIVERDALDERED